MLADAAVALLGRQDIPIAQMPHEQVLALCDAMMSVDEQHG